MRILILLIPTLLCVLSSQGLAARPFDLRAGPGTLHAQSIKPETTSAASPRLDSRAAAARVKQRYQGHKILAIQLVEARASSGYRVKMLSPEGVVTSVFVEGRSGDVFE